MSNAVANRAQLSFVRETALGGTLSGTTFKRLRILSEGIVHQPLRQRSGQIEPDRNLVEVMDLGVNAAGPIEAELSFSDFQELLIAALCARGTGTADTPAAGTTRYLNGTVIDWFYFEKNFTDVAKLVGVYGGVINEVTITFEANKEVLVSFGIVAQKTAKEAATRSTAYTAPSSDAVFRSGADVATLKLGGSTIAAAVRKLTISIRNNFSMKPEVGSAVATEAMAHSFEVSGVMETYFPTLALYDDMVASTMRALEVKAGNAVGAFTFHLPAINLTGGTPTIPGQNGDVIKEIPFLAVKGVLGAASCTMGLDVDPA